MYQWIVFLHVLAALMFFMCHGASVAMVFQLRRERNFDRLRAIMQLSTSMENITFVALLVLLIAGIAAGFMGNWWSQGWIGTSLVLLIAIFVWMSFYVQRNITPLRLALGLPHPHKKKEPAPPQASDEEIYAAAQRIQPWVLLGPGMIITLIILWLMMFKPF